VRDLAPRHQAGFAKYREEGSSPLLGLVPAALPKLRFHR